MGAATTKLISGDSFWLEAYIDPFNKRLRIDDLQGNLNNGMRKAEEIARKISTEKLIIKARLEQFSELLALGFVCEAKLDGYFLGSDAYFFSKFFREERRRNELWVLEDEKIHQVFQLVRTNNDKLILASELELRKAELYDAVKLSQLYREVFPIYPTPLHDPDYIGKTIKQGTIYYLFESENKIVSAASAEVNTVYKNAELTDCATLPSHRKLGLVKILLKRLEEELMNKGIFCAYSSSRAQSFGMNAAFYQLDYQYRGRLLNNCFIYDKLENMNLWVKDLSK